MNTYWWFRPSRIALFVVMPIEVLSFLASDRFYRQFGAFNAITPEHFFLGWLAIIGFAGASWFGEVLLVGQPQRHAAYMSESNFRFLVFGLGFVAMCATAIFLAPYAANPSLVLNILHSEAGASEIARKNANQISGITSQENLFNLVVVLLMLKSVLTGRSRTNAERLLLGLVIFISFAKVIVHGERLALIEILVPLCLVTAAIRKRSVMWAVAPLAGVFGLSLFFVMTEYFRSWVSWYADRSSDGLVVFALERALAYYATAVNNSAWVYDEMRSYFFPVFTAQWLWHLPIPGLADWLANVVGITVPDPQFVQELLAGQNGEFNNISGIFLPIIDFGPAVGIIIWMALGYCAGRLYRGFRDCHLLGLILFPTWYVGVLEIPRIFYWGDNRYFPSLVVSLTMACTLLYLVPRSRARRWSDDDPMPTSDHSSVPQLTSVLRPLMEVAPDREVRRGFRAR